jgi:hypothetical protein
VEETQQDDKDKGVKGVVTMDIVAPRSSLHQVPLLNPVWIRSTVWKWPVLLLLSAGLDDLRSKSPRVERVNEVVGVDAMHRVSEVVEAVPVAMQWM